MNELQKLSKYLAVQSEIFESRDPALARNLLRASKLLSGARGFWQVKADWIEKPISDGGYCLCPTDRPNYKSPHCVAHDIAADLRGE